MAYFDTTWYTNYGNGSSTGYFAVPVWAANTAYTVGQFVRQLATPTVGNERCFVCVVAGTSHATTEPTWVVTRGALSPAAGTDGTVKWQECTGMPGTCGDITNTNVWTNGVNFSIGSMIYVVSNGSLQIVTTSSGNTSGSIPAFSAVAGTTTNDGSNVWTSLGLASGYAAWAKPHARITNMIASGWAAAGSNNLWVSNHSAETKAAAQTFSNLGSATSPYKIICVDDAAAPPTVAATGATYSTTGASTIAFGGGGGTSTYMQFYGIQFNAGDSSNTASIAINGGSGGIDHLYFENCTLKLNNTSASSKIQLGTNSGAQSNQTLKGCTYLFGDTGQQITLGTDFTHVWGGTAAASGSIPTTLFGTQARMQWGLVKDLDASTVTGTLVAIQSQGNLLFQNCKVGAGITLGNTGGLWRGGTIKVANCDSATTNYRYFFSSYNGTVQQETAIVRTGSLATDGTTPISWSLVTTANSNYGMPFVTEEIAIWNDTTGSPITATFYLISNTTLNNDDFWAEVEYLSGSGSLGATVDSRRALLSSATPLTSDSSTWGGSTNKYKIVLTFTPGNKGPIKARFYAAKASQTTYVDPYIYLGT